MLRGAVTDPYLDTGPPGEETCNPLRSVNDNSEENGRAPGRRSCVVDIVCPGLNFHTFPA